MFPHTNYRETALNNDFRFIYRKSSAWSCRIGVTPSLIKNMKTFQQMLKTLEPRIRYTKDIFATLITKGVRENLSRAHLFL